MTTNVLLVCGEVSDQQVAPLLQLMNERGEDLEVVRLGNKYKYEGLKSRKAMFKKYGKGGKIGQNGLRMLERQAEMLNDVLVKSVGEDHEVLVVLFGVPERRDGDDWNWVDTFFMNNGVPYWWLEAWSDGVYQLVSSDEPNTALRVPAA